MSYLAAINHRVNCLDHTGSFLREGVARKQTLYLAHKPALSDVKSVTEERKRKAADPCVTSIVLYPLLGAPKSEKNGCTEASFRLQTATVSLVANVVGSRVCFGKRAICVFKTLTSSPFQWQLLEISFNMASGFSIEATCPSYTRVLPVCPAFLRSLSDAFPASVRIKNVRCHACRGRV